MSTATEALDTPPEPPNIELMLAHICRHEGVYGTARQHLTLQDFNHPGEMYYRAIWAALTDLHEQYGQLPSQSVLSALVLSRLQADSEVTDEGIQKANDLLRWIWTESRDEDLNPSLANAILREFLLQRRISTQLEERGIATRSLQSVQDIEQLFADIGAHLQRLRTIGCQQVVPIGEQLQTYYANMARYRGHEILGLRTGLPIFDERMCGLRGFIALGAAPGVGKSVFALQVGTNVCRHCETNDAVVIVLSLDMGKSDLLHRLHCLLARIDWQTYVLGSPGLRGNRTPPHFTPGHQHQIDAAQQRLTEWQIAQRLTILDRADVDQLGVSGIAAAAVSLRDRVGAARVLIIVDYLGLLPIPENLDLRSELEADKYRVRTVQRILDELRCDADPFGVAALVISEARKPSETRMAQHNWGCKVEDLMGSARLGYAADAVLIMRPANDTELVHRYGDVYSQGLLRQLDQEGIAPLTITLAKGRDGMTRGSWGVEFHFRESRMVEGTTARPVSAAFTPPPRYDGSAQAAGVGRDMDFDTDLD